jgi:hypothetical protein
MNERCICAIRVEPGAVSARPYVGLWIGRAQSDAKAFPKCAVILCVVMGDVLSEIDATSAKTVRRFTIAPIVGALRQRVA